MIENAITISLCCVAIHALFSEGMALFQLGVFISAVMNILAFLFVYPFEVWFGTVSVSWERSLKVSNWICKPLFDCLSCMSSFWSVIIGHCYLHLSWQDTGFIALIVLGLNWVMDSVIGYLRHTNDTTGAV